MTLETLLKGVPVIPVLAIRDLAQAVPLARALVAGGLPVLEITLRTPAALEAIRAIKGEVEGALVGVGTVLRPDDLDRAAAAGAVFAVSPGLTEDLARAALAGPLPLLPGTATASEMMRARELGFTAVKFFPAAQAGGPAALKAVAPVLPEMRFCPTGGVSAANMAEYLALPNVFCVGGSWVAPDAAIAAGDWQAITVLASEAVGRAVKTA
ncbi:MAG: bifunctional 4-hydroxy-2-oxoglutarate aldolase/2-dehydro-3-deoxy-phosphogluconate aldolase [Alphaproteobacteria bacterium]|nr:bifunctional 4-hydroxy-2-oxoglutarate aldolase/2-dehydro-3-deoxy-phosphogluconate aldolase [Alphaproteobacteria bacterium]